ncbi:MAG TPA: carboxypeptidase regulatory-like domain-containing protein [Chryseolinea sp.]
MSKILLLFAVVLISFSGALAQGVTTSSISGFVTDQKGEALPGANVIAVHQPSGTQYGTSTLADGKFIIPNARVGGPYKITVSFVGYDTKELGDIMLTLGVTTNAEFQLVESGTQLQEITVSGNSVINSDRTGAITTISNKQISQLPTLSRSFQDYVRLTPQANSATGGPSFAGRSNGYNNITVDGGLFNNAFGLSGSVGGQTNAQPISLDAVDQITTSIAPYDVREGSFTGAGINVVSRSGTNDVTGSVYYFTRSENLTNDKVGSLSSPLGTFSVKNYGFRIGAPIIKNKLFIFANYEVERRDDPGTLWSASRPGASGSNVSAVQASDLDALSTFLSETYGFGTGPYEGYDLETNSDKAAVKLDWNISTNHKLTVKYNYLDSYRDVVPSTSGAIGNTRSPGQTGMPYLAAYYRINNNLNGVSAELNSTIGNKYSNKVQIGYTAFRDFREIPTSSLAFPMVDIGNGSNNFLTAFGTEPFSANNILNTDVIQISDNFDMYLGKHTVSVGTYNEIYKFQNGFAPAYYGLYQFATLDNFYLSAAGNPGNVARYELRWAANAEGEFPLVETRATQLGFYAQDKYEVSKKFNFTVGLRVDIPIISSDIALNEDAASKTFRDGQTIQTDQLQKTSVLWSPRVGFNYDINGDNKTQIRGGTGVFTGRVPYVWISNQASNNGVLFGSRVFSGADLAAITFSGDVNQYRPVGDAAVASASYNLAVTSDNFKFPQVWRTNIAIDHDFGQMVIASLDVAYTKDMNAVYHQNINLPNATEFATGADNRPIFYKTFPNTGASAAKGSQINTNISDAIVMTNTKKGYSYFITAQVKKSFLFGLDAFVAYTYTDSRSVNDGGSIAQSIWRDRQISGDPNENVQSYFTNLARHRAIASVNYRKEYLGFMGTSLGVFYELAPNGRFSYVYSGDMNGDNSGGGGNDLLYVPRDQSEILLTNITNSDGTIYTADQQWADLDAYINQDEYLSERRGQYAERNGAERPYFGQLDLRILQDFFIDIKGDKKKRNTLQLSIDIFNFGNLLNSEWGVYKIANRNTLVNFTGYNDQKRPTFQYPYLNATTKTPLLETYRDDLNVISRWQMQIGLRYIFGN